VTAAVLRELVRGHSPLDQALIDRLRQDNRRLRRELDQRRAEQRAIVAIIRSGQASPTTAR
jgi:hypothetical protein